MSKRTPPRRTLWLDGLESRLLLAYNSSEGFKNFPTSFQDRPTDQWYRWYPTSTTPVQRSTLIWNEKHGGWTYNPNVIGKEWNAYYLHFKDPGKLPKTTSNLSFDSLTVRNAWAFDIQARHFTSDGRRITTSDGYNRDHNLPLKDHVDGFYLWNTKDAAAEKSMVVVENVQAIDIETNQNVRWEGGSAHRIYYHNIYAHNPSRSRDDNIPNPSDWTGTGKAYDWIGQSVAVVNISDGARINEIVFDNVSADKIIVQYKDTNDDGATTRGYVGKIYFRNTNTAAADNPNVPHEQPMFANENGQSITPPSGLFAPAGTVPSDLNVARPFSGTPFDISGSQAIEAEKFDRGGEAISFHENTRNNPAYGPYESGQVDLASGSALGDTADATGTGVVGEAGEWLDYTITVPVEDDYTIQARAGGGTGAQIHVDVDDADFMPAATELLTPTSGWQTLSRQQPIHLKPGTHVVHVAFVGNEGAAAKLNWLKLVPVNSSAPAAPSNLTATAVSPTRVDLSWSDGSNNETGFKIQRKIGTGNWQTIHTAPTQSTSYADTTVSPNTSYTYQIVATNGSGDSAPSNPANVQTPAATTIPTVPGSFTATAVSDSRIDLSWSDSTNEDGYVIERSLDGTFSDALILNAPANATSFSDEGLAAATTYHYRIKAVNGAGSSAFTTPVSAMTLADRFSGFNPGIADASEQTVYTWKPRSAGDSVTIENEVHGNLSGVRAFRLVWQTAGIPFGNVTIRNAKAHDMSLSGGVTPGGFYLWNTSAGTSSIVDIIDSEATDIEGGHGFWWDGGSAQRLMFRNTGTKNTVKSGVGKYYVKVSTGDVIDQLVFDNARGEIQFALNGGTINTIWVNDSEISAATLQSRYPSLDIRAGLPPQLAAPATPSNLVATSTTREVNLSWTDNSSNEEGFRIYRGLDGPAGWTQVATVGPNVTSFQDTNFEGSLFYYRVVAFNRNGAASTETVEQVAPSQPQIAYRNPFNATIRIEAEQYDTGGEGFAYHDIDAGNNYGAYRNDDVDIEPTVDSSGYMVSRGRPGEWLEYTVWVPQTGLYNINVRTANGAAGGSFHIEFDGVNKTGTLSSPNSAWAMQTVTKTGVYLEAGQHVMRLSLDQPSGTGSAGNYNWIDITRDGGSVIEAESYDAESGTELHSNGSRVGWLDDGDYLQYDNVDLGSGVSSIQMNLSVDTNWAGKQIEVRAGSVTGTLLGTINVNNVATNYDGANTGSGTTGWGSYFTRTAAISGASGVQKIFLVFKGGANVATIDWFQFL